MRLYRVFPPETLEAHFKSSRVRNALDRYKQQLQKKPNSIRSASDRQWLTGQQTGILQIPLYRNCSKKGERGHRLKLDRACEKHITERSASVIPVLKDKGAVIF